MRLIDADALSELLVKTYETAPTEKALLFVALLLKNNEQVPTVPLPDFKEGYKQAILDGKTNYVRPKGEWIEHSDGYISFCTCNKCNDFGYKDDKFCHNCGAKMQKGGAENER